MKELNEHLVVAETMKKFGGSFVRSLGEALLLADHINQHKIKTTFHEYWKQYKEIAEKAKYQDK